MAFELSFLDADPGPELSHEQREQQRLVDEVFTSKFGRPLIVIGSGVSTDKVPDMKAVFRYISSKIDSALVAPEAQKYEQVQLKTLQETSELAKSLAGGLRHRPLAARLFGELQNSAVPAVQDVWKAFCTDFLNGEIEPQRQPILTLTPTRTHEALATLCEKHNSIVLSFNFDGLTYWALREHFKEKPDRVFILDDPQKINEFYGRKPGEPADQREWPVWKVRGDIFFAVCRQSGCPSRDVASPIYKLALERQPEGSKNAQLLLKCPECGTQRSLQISFPGLEKKERDTDAILDELWRYVAPTLSGICFSGLSGIWDEAVVKSLLTLAAHRNLPVLDIRPSPSEPDPDDKYISLLANASFPSVRYSRIVATSESFFVAATSIQSVSATITESTLSPENLPTDQFWDKAEHFSVTGWAAGLPVPGTSTDLAYHIANHADVRHLAAYSQLGLKNYWWGRDTFKRHNRYLHSLGTLRVAATWHQQLGPLIQKRLHPARTPNFQQERSLVMIASLLHDYGHLAFSHLCEQIFKDLNWSPHFGKPYNHLDVGVDKIATLLSTGQIHAQQGAAYQISDELAAIGYDANDVVRLIRGGTGVGYLDAILNSPIDADKIDYIFRDSSELNLGVRLPPPDAWLHEFLEDQDLSPEGLIRLNRRSALRMLELLETRKALYQDFYLSPWIRVIEALAADVITRYLIIETSLEMMHRLRDNTLTNPDPDWGALKLTIATERLETLYAQVIARQQNNEALEQPLLVQIITLLEADPHGTKFDQGFKEFLSRAKELFREFDSAGSNRGNGELLRSLYQRIHLAARGETRFRV